MIPRITRGASAYGALHYDHGPGRRDEHENPHRVAGSLFDGSWKQRAHSIDQHIKNTRPEITKPIVRTSLRLAPEDRKLTDREWRKVAETYVEKMGFRECPWEAVRHADDHIHLTVSRITWDGRVVDQRQNYVAAQRAVRVIEREHGLVNAAERYRSGPDGGAQLSRNDDPAAVKVVLRERLTAAERASDGTRAGYEAALSAHGVRARANVSKPTEKNPQGRMNGYSYCLDEHTDATGVPVWFKGSQLGKGYGWTATAQRLERVAQEPRGIERPAQPKAEASSASAQRPASLEEVRRWAKERAAVVGEKQAQQEAARMWAQQSAHDRERRRAEREKGREQERER